MKPILLLSALFLGATAYQCKDAEVQRGATLFVRSLCVQMEGIGGVLCADDFVKCMLTRDFRVMDSLQMCSVAMSKPEIADLNTAYGEGCLNTNEAEAIQFGCCLIEKELYQTNKTVTENLTASRGCVEMIAATYGTCT